MIIFKKKKKKKAVDDKNVHVLEFWGVRGTIPTPQAEMLGVGGDTPCIQITASSGELLIFDMGTGLRMLGNKLLQTMDGPIKGHIFISHTHWDHIQGFPFFGPAFVKGNHFVIYGPEKSGDKVSDTLAGQMENRYWPVSIGELNSRIEYRDLPVGRLKISDNLIVETALHSHPNGAYGYRVELGKRVITYMTDCEHPLGGLDELVVELARDSDVLIHDAHFSAEELSSHLGWGHSSWEKCVNVAKAANVKQLVLFHFNPNYTDETIFDFEEKARSRFPNTVAAKQGLKINIPAD